jgi:hypothetical protein
MSNESCDIHVHCEECRKHIPKSAALTSENSDMVAHFCCPECLDSWEEKQEETQS